MKILKVLPVDPSFIGIDYHKRYSVFCVVDSTGNVLRRGRIDHALPSEFAALMKRHSGCRVVFEASMKTRLEWDYMS